MHMGANLHAKEINISERQGLELTSASRTKETREQNASSYNVIWSNPRKPRTAGRDGLSVQELKRIHAAGRFIFERGWAAVHVTVAAHHVDDEVSLRKTLREIKSRISDCQRRGGMKRQYSITVFEATCSTHAHILVAASPEAARLLRRISDSPKFSKFDDAGNAFIDTRKVTRRGIGSWCNYVSKEMSTWTRKTAGSHLPCYWRGRHRLEMGGDRVRLSRPLKADLERYGAIQAYHQTYAKRADKA